MFVILGVLIVETVYFSILAVLFPVHVLGLVWDFVHGVLLSFCVEELSQVFLIS